MCGRYRLSRRKQIVEEYFDTVSGEEEWAPRYNIAPTQPVPIIRQSPKEPVRELSLMRWGLIPRTGKTKQPYCFEIGEGEMFAFAGLWNRWKDCRNVRPKSRTKTAVSIVTYPPLKKPP
jgi:putative SOS response-associated peptidase YedK